MSAAVPISCTSASKSRGRPLGPVAVEIRGAVLGDLVHRYERATVRQVFYALEVAGVVDKTEAGYRQVQTQILKMRREGLLSWSFITDGTRWQRKPSSWDSADDYVRSVARSYRRDLWQSQERRIEFWLEKDALADVVYEVTDSWDVSLMVSRGQSSLTFLHGAAQAARRAFEHDGTVTSIYTMYDFDAGGARSARTIRRDLPELAGVPINITELAVTEEQISVWDLPTRPAKRSDPEAAKWGDRGAVELDAMTPQQLQTLVQDAIVENVDARQWRIERFIEAEERDGLLRLVDGAES